MSILDLNYRQNGRHIKALKENIKTIVPFLGAGASMPYGYLSWPKLLSNVLNSVRNGCDNMTEDTNQKIQDDIDGGAYMTATNKMYRYWKHLEGYVRNEIENVKPNGSSCLEKYLHLFPSKLYLTTNYDNVVETILTSPFRKHDVKFNIISNPIEFNTASNTVSNPLKNEATLYYLHGKYPDTDSIIFSETDYNDVYGRVGDIKTVKSIQRRAIARKLYEASRYPFLFIGCGLNMDEDRYLQLLKKFNELQLLKNDSYALLDSKGLTPKQIDIKKAKLTQIRVCPIWYCGDSPAAHEQAKEELLEYILGENRKIDEAWLTEYEAQRKKQRQENQVKEKEREEREKQQEKLKKEIKESPSVEMDRFSFPQKFYYNCKSNYEFVYYKSKNNRNYLSDQGRTYEMLDKIFELEEPDVRKNLKRIADECKVIITDDNPRILIFDLKSDAPSKDEIEHAKWVLFTCVAFMDSMRIFYI